MGLVVEFNTVLALRNNQEYRDGNREADECIPDKLTVGSLYTFTKQGQRIYALNKEMPLLETQGNHQFSSELAIVSIQEVSHYLEQGEVYTKGSYRVIRLAGK